MPDLESSKIVSETIAYKHGLVALIGGLANAINKHRTGESKGFLDFIALSVMSSFFGIITGFIAVSLFGTNEYLTLSVAGTGGWLGIETTGILQIWIKKILK